MDAGGGTTQAAPAPANFYENGNYIGLRELTLSYELPSEFFKKYLKNKIQGFRIYVAGSNLAYFTKYSGNFPDVGGNDVGRFPLPRTVIIGLNLTL
ncbi:MAG: hypothetical protein JNJ72_19720, partial [Anaerolineales bacterium]|nr:hypothetical protein [Anaerolineales bacterium]